MFSAAGLRRLPASIRTLFLGLRPNALSQYSCWRTKLPQNQKMQHFAMQLADGAQSYPKTKNAASHRGK